jgi:hypothetical protein
VRKSILALGAIVALFGLSAVPAFAGTSVLKVPDPTPTGTFSDGENAGYAEVLDDGVRACNENPNTPAGDQLTGYAWVSASGESTPPTYGNENIGAGDADGEGNLDEDTNNNGQLDTEDTNGNGTLDPGEDANGNGQLDTEDTNGNGTLDVQTHDCP